MKDGTCGPGTNLHTVFLFLEQGFDIIINVAVRKHRLGIFRFGIIESFVEFYNKSELANANSCPRNDDG